MDVGNGKGGGERIPIGSRRVLIGDPSMCRGYDLRPREGLTSSTVTSDRSRESVFSEEKAALDTKINFLDLSSVVGSDLITCKKELGRIWIAI